MHKPCKACFQNVDLVAHLSGPDRCEMVVRILYGGVGEMALVGTQAWEISGGPGSEEGSRGKLDVETDVLR